jgi:hypothetical protein
MRTKFAARLRAGRDEHGRIANILWQPLLRDGGARLSKRDNLYDLTRDRDTDLFQDNLQKITE